MKVMLRYALLPLGLALLPFSASAQLPDGPGRAELEKICRGCHELARSISKLQDRDGWHQTMTRMVAFGMKSTDREYAAVLDYLAKYYPAEEVPRVNVNKATAIEMEAGLSLKRSEARAVLAWRAQHGEFKSLDDLKKVPLLDPTKIDAKKDRITF
jgi:competence protein ComEA